MKPPANERHYRGVQAAPGLVLGPALPLRDAVQAQPRRAGSPAVEAADFEAALSAAAGELAGLAQDDDDVAASILEFQRALLDDTDLLAPVRDAIRNGRPADQAWLSQLDDEIAEYTSADDEHFAARASDLRDLRDRVLRHLRKAAVSQVPLPHDSIIVADDMAPTAFLGMDWRHAGGLALQRGSVAGHVAILARARGVPMLVGLGGEANPGKGELVVLDADRNLLIVGPGSATRAAVAKRRQAAAAQQSAAETAARDVARTADGHAVTVLVNIDAIADLERVPVETCDGVGLVRSEFLFADDIGDEAAHYATYAAIVRWAAGRPVTIRTLDAGGDKPVAGLTLEGERNPFLGVRGLRLSLARPALFRLQLRALARAAALGPVKIMLPMVSVPRELAAARAHLDAVCAELAKAGIAHARPPLGIMIETPVAALSADGFDADFYSIGSNDLIQYIFAAARDASELNDLVDPLHPAVIELIRRTVTAGRDRSVEVSLCGDMASQPELLAPLLALGLDTLSVAPAVLGRVKLAIAAAHGPRQVTEP